MSASDILKRIITKLELTGFADHPGRLLYSGVATLCPGPLYLLGFNPGGDPNDESESPKAHLEAFRNMAPDWNEYLDGIWKPRGVAYPPGASGMQMRVHSLLSTLGYQTRSVCASNLIFVRSRVAGALGDPKSIADRCWPVHEFILSVVRPKVILSIGREPFEFIINKGRPLGLPNQERFPSGQGNLACRAALVQLGVQQVILISVPHLGDRVRYEIANHPDAVQWVRTKIGRND